MVRVSVEELCCISATLLASAHFDRVSKVENLFTLPKLFSFLFHYKVVVGLVVVLSFEEASTIANSVRIIDSMATTLFRLPRLFLLRIGFEREFFPTCDTHLIELNLV